MSYEERITLDPAVLSGKPVIRGTRLSVEHVIGLLADCWSAADIKGQYPGITDTDVLACLAYAREVLASERRTAMPGTPNPALRPARAPQGAR